MELESERTNVFPIFSGAAHSRPYRSNVGEKFPYALQKPSSAFHWLLPAATVYSSAPLLMSAVLSQGMP